MALGNKAAQLAKVLAVRASMLQLKSLVLIGHQFASLVRLSLIQVLAPAQVPAKLIIGFATSRFSVV